MTDKDKLEEVTNAMQGSNPTAEAGKKAERKRIPLTLPQAKLSVPEIPGFHLYWFRGTSQRLAQAHAAGYDWVRPEEVDINNTLLGGDASKTGSTDMGSRVSIAEGGDAADGSGNAIRLYLMKQPMEYYLEDQKLLQQRNDSIADTLTSAYRTGQVGGLTDGERPEDIASRYVDPKRGKVPELFRRKVK